MRVIQRHGKSTHWPATVLVKLKNTLLCLDEEHAGTFDLVLHESSPLVSHLPSEDIVVCQAKSGQFVLG